MGYGKVLYIPDIDLLLTHLQVTVILCVFLLSYMYGEGKVSYYILPNFLGLVTNAKDYRVIISKGAFSCLLIWWLWSVSTFPDFLETQTPWESTGLTRSPLGKRPSRLLVGREAGGPTDLGVRRMGIVY